MKVSQVTLEVLNPQGATVEHVRQEIAPRLTDLNGKTIGLLCNWLTGHEYVFENVENVNDKFEKYIFTDVFKTFLRKAKKDEYFAKYDFIEYKELDVTKSITEQEIEKEQADIVLAVNVLHATDNLLEGCKTFLDLVGT